MDLESYLKGPGASEQGCQYLRRLVLGSGYGIWVAGGLWLFGEETAHSWAGPWPGGYAAWRLTDHTETIAPVWQGRARKHRHDSAKPMKLTERGDEIEKTYGHHGQATTQRPFSLQLAGTDDAAFVKSYPSLEAALLEIELFETNQPLDFRIVYDFGFFP